MLSVLVAAIVLTSPAPRDTCPCPPRPAIHRVVRHPVRPHRRVVRRAPARRPCPPCPEPRVVERVVERVIERERLVVERDTVRIKADPVAAGAWVGGSWINDDGRDLASGEVGFRRGPLGARALLAGREDVYLGALDLLVFAPRWLYAGIGFALEARCNDGWTTVRWREWDGCRWIPHSTTVRSDRCEFLAGPTVLAGVQTPTRPSVFGEARALFGDDERAAFSAGLRASW